MEESYDLNKENLDDQINFDLNKENLDSQINSDLNKENSDLNKKSPVINFCTPAKIYLGALIIYLIILFILMIADGQFLLGFIYVITGFLFFGFWLLVIIGLCYIGGSVYSYIILILSIIIWISNIIIVSLSL